MVHSFVTISYFLAALASSALASSSLLAERQSTTCSSLHLMVAGGCALPCSVDVLSYLSTTVGNITAAIPNTDLYLVPYDGSEFQGAVSTNLMIQAANEYASECPNTPIAFIGYSLGGIVVMNTVCGGISYNPNVIAAVTYGEETFVYPTSYDKGTCTMNAPKYPRTNQAACEPFAPVIQDYCDGGDPQCCTGGINPSSHFTYPALYDLDVLAFVESQYAAFAATHNTTSTTSTTSSSVPSYTSPSTTGIPTYSTLTPYGNSSTVSPGIPTTPSAVETMTLPPGSYSVSSSAITTVIAGTTTTVNVPAPAMTSSTVMTVVGGSTVTQVITIALTTTVPLYTPAGLTSPSIPTTGFLTSGLIPVTGVALSSSAIPTQYLMSEAPPSPSVSTSLFLPGGPATQASSGLMPNPSSTSGLTPFNPNAAASVAVPGFLFAQCLVLAWRLLV